MKFSSMLAAPLSLFHLLKYAKRFLNLLNIHKRTIFELTPARCVWNSMYI